MKVSNPHLWLMMAILVGIFIAAGSAHSFPTRPPDLRRFPLATRASRFLARSPWSAAPGIRFLYVGPWVTFHASFRRSVTLPPLRFRSVPVARSREDFHLQECARAGRTKKSGGHGDHRSS